METHQEQKNLPSSMGQGSDLIPDGAAQRECDLFNSAEGAKRADGFYCPKCKNKRLIGYLEYYDGMWYQMTRPCECQQTLKNLAAIKASGLQGDIPRLDTFEANEDWQKDVLIKAKAFIEDKDARCFYIGGQTGAGKTHLCSGIAWELMHKGKSLRYFCWAKEAAKLTDFANQSRFERIDELSKVDVLYIDDLLKPTTGTKYTTPELRLAFELIDEVYRNHEKKIIISSEIYLRELAQIDEATAGRIAEMAGQYRITIDKDVKKNYRFNGEL